MDLSEFKAYVAKTFEDDDVCHCVFFKSKHTGQHFAGVVTEEDGVYWSFVVANERHLKKQRIRSENCNRASAKSKQSYGKETAVKNCTEMYNELVKDEFSQNFGFRVYNVDPNCYYNPDKYLVKGDVIQRDLIGGLPASHEGIYVGNGMVIHNTNGKNICKTTLKEFAGGSDVQLRVVDYCIQRKTPDEICTLAESFLKINKKYNVVFNNCQHFTSLCATGVEFMTDKRQLTEKIVVSGIIITVIAQGTLHKLAKEKQEINGITIIIATSETIAEYYLVIVALVSVTVSPLATKRTETYRQTRPIYVENTHATNTNILEPIANGAVAVVDTFVDGICAIGNGFVSLFTAPRRRQTQRQNNDVLYN
uniref:LRAT domain-containing protein n=1 Tax=Panagrellus redivivus TaxID=6233 RepID=A0A7E4UQY6_PANRE